LFGNGGSDTADYANAASVGGLGLTIDLSNPANNTGEAAGDTYNSIENIRGSSFNDTLKGDAGANKLTGGLVLTRSSMAPAAAPIRSRTSITVRATGSTSPA